MRGDRSNRDGKFQSLEEREVKLKKMKGQPVALKKFLEEVVLPGCVLCPP